MLSMWEPILILIVRQTCETRCGLLKTVGTFEFAAQVGLLLRVILLRREETVQ